jgi:hypothetical protein
VSTSKQRYRRRRRAELAEERFILFGVKLWLQNMHKSSHTLPGEWEMVYDEYVRRFPKRPPRRWAVSCEILWDTMVMV